ncbi:MAG: hypothetical protein M1493_02935 [Firmicutes bacterium]|nr:hypothetical protein [Bacillota bacterium]
MESSQPFDKLLGGLVAWHIPRWAASTSIMAGKIPPGMGLVAWHIPRWAASTSIMAGKIPPGIN